MTDDAPECFARVPSHFRDLVEAGNGFHVTLVRHAQIFDAAFLLPRLYQRDHDVDVDEAVALHQIDFVSSEPFARQFETVVALIRVA